MGALIRFLSLHCSATLTAAATRGQRRMAATPSPSGLKFLLPLLLAACLPAGAATPYVTDYGYTNTVTEGPIYAFDVYDNLVSSTTRTNSTSTSYNFGVGAFESSRNEEVTTWFDGNGDVAELQTNVNETTRTWGWINGGLDEGSGSSVSSVVSTVPGGNSTTTTHWSPAGNPPFSIPTTGCVGNQTTTDSENVSQTVEDAISTMKFNTGGPAGSTTNRLWRLKLNLSLTNPNDPGVQIPLPANGVTLQGLTTDTNGCVLVMLPDNTEVDVTPSGVNYSFYYFTVEADQVELVGIEWWNPATTNWSTGDLYVLTNSTVTFRGKGNVPDVPWPTNALTWTADGQSYVAPQISVTFDTVSTSVTNPYPITVSMATNAFTNWVVAYTVEPSIVPDDNFTGRATNQFGVCEIINFNLAIMPEDMPVSEIKVLDWQFVAADTNATFSTTSSGTGSAILFGPSTPTTITVNLAVGDNFQVRNFTWSFPFIIPSSLLCVPTTIAYGPHGPGVWHTNNTGSCGKKLLFYLFPAAVSFREIHIREGTSTNEFGTGVCPPPAPHSPSTNWAAVNAGDSTTGCLVNVVDQASTGPWGVGQPRTFFLPNGGTRGFDIWIEYKGINEGDNKARRVFTVPWRVTISSNGRTEIKKDSMTPIAREWDDPYSNY